MSTREIAAQMGEISHEHVALYLKNNPEFFNNYPELLAEIRVPHATGAAISLVEKQLKVLRNQNEQSRQRLHELVEIARQNEELAHKMHQLTLTLMEADNPQNIFKTLYENLSEHFRADKVAVRLFAKPACIDPFPGGEFAEPDSTEQTLFHAIIDKRTPISGTLKKQQQVFLFGDEGDDIASAVLVPLHGLSWGGIMAIGSRDKQRFNENMGVELLSNMSEVLSFILKPWIAEESSS